MKIYYVYILSSCRGGTLYTGVTNNLVKRVAQLKRKEKKSFTEQYGVNRLVWYDQTSDIRIAIQKEKQIKKWKRTWKIRLINKTNFEWKDLFYDIGGTDDLLEPDFDL